MLGENSDSPGENAAPREKILQRSVGARRAMVCAPKSKKASPTIGHKLGYGYQKAGIMRRANTGRSTTIIDKGGKRLRRGWHRAST